MSIWDRQTKGQPSNGFGPTKVVAPHGDLYDQATDLCQLSSSDVFTFELYTT